MHGAYVFLIIWILVIAANAVYQMYYKEKAHLLKVDFIAWLVFQANSNPWTGFYPLKDKLLKQYGKTIGYEYQHFDALKCNRCYKGVWTSYDGMHSERCWCCKGTGIYKPEIWVGLAKYQLGRYEFHLPVGKSEKPDPKPHPSFVIEGKIRHEVQKYCNEANLLLSILYKLKAKPKFKFGYVLNRTQNPSLYVRLNNSLVKYHFPWHYPTSWYGRIYITCYRALCSLKLIDELPF